MCVNQLGDSEVTQADRDWQTLARVYVGRVDCEELLKGLEGHKQCGRREWTYRYCPSAYHRALVRCIEANDERGFMMLKSLHEARGVCVSC
jgi:hypothetical protein